VTRARSNYRSPSRVTSSLERGNFLGKVSAMFLRIEDRKRLRSKQKRIAAKKARGLRSLLRRLRKLRDLRRLAETYRTASFGSRYLRGCPSREYGPETGPKRLEVAVPDTPARLCKGALQSRTRHYEAVRCEKETYDFYVAFGLGRVSAPRRTVFRLVFI
jgi:hypothetical protein